jgi:hypothetical protein
MTLMSFASSPMHASNSKNDIWPISIIKNGKESQCQGQNEIKGAISITLHQFCMSFFPKQLFHTNEFLNDFFGNSLWKMIRISPISHKKKFNIFLINMNLYKCTKSLQVLCFMLKNDDNLKSYQKILKIWKLNLM